MRRSLLGLLTVAAIAGLLVTGCKSPMGLDKDVGADWHWVTPPPDTFQFRTGTRTQAGIIVVWNVADTLYIEYHLTGDWWLEATNVDVKTRFDRFPRRCYDDPDEERFEFRNARNPRVQNCTLAIPVQTGWKVGTLLYIATHAQAARLDRYGKVCHRDGGCWGGRCQFRSRSWATCITYEFKGAYKDVDLPSGTCQMSGSTTSHTCYWDIVLTNVPEGGEVSDGTYKGWCGQLDAGFLENHLYESVTMWSTADPDLPESLQNDGWHNVNYLLNHYTAADSWYDVQDAIWGLLGTDISEWASTEAIQLASDAETNGVNWHPTSGYKMAVILETAPVVDTTDTGVDTTAVQRCFIEVDP
jgi:hypothetical protein